MVISCPDCHQPVSLKAWTCPHCGRPCKQHPIVRMRRIGWVFTAIVILVIITAFAVALANS